MILFVTLAKFCPAVFQAWPVDLINNFLLILFIGTFVMPLFMIILYVTLNKGSSLKSLSMADRKERVIPFFLTAIFYCGITWLLYENLRVNPEIVAIMVCISISIVLVSIITFFWKISVHTTGIFGILGFLLVINYLKPDNQLFYPIIVFFILAGLLTSARMYLQAHCPSQIIGGILLGLSSSLLSYFLI